MKSFKVDLHCHSYYSRVTDNKLMSAFCVNESYDSPTTIYKMAKKRGMDAVTITDHNVITGCLRLKEKFDDVYISEEICTYFPEDNFRMHVIAMDIDEAIHQEISRLRFNVYELVAYFKQQGILHVQAHPAWGPSIPPKREHYEKFMVLFDKWEFLNGSRSWKNHDFTKALAASYTLEKGRQLADKHGLPEPTHTQIFGFAGSDAHNVRNVGTTFTQAVGAKSYKEFLDKFKSGEITYHGKVQTTLPFAHTVYDLLGKHYSYGQSFIVRKIKDKPTKSLARMHFSPLKKFCRPVHRDSYTEAELLRRIDKVLVKKVRRMLRKLVSRRGIDLTRDAAYPLVDLALLYTPLISAANYKYNFDHNLPKADDFFPNVDRQQATRIALFGDNMHRNHGISTRIREMVRYANSRQHTLIPVTCAPEATNEFKAIKPLLQLPLPHYTGQDLFIPSFAEIMLFLERENIELVHLSTPGTLGFFTLLAAKAIGLPVIGSYHTDVTDYIRHYNKNPIFEQLFGKAQTFFYNQCDLVLALSEHSRQFLIDSGVARDKLHIMKTGVDHRTFRPDIEAEAFRKTINPDNRFMILFAGRLEREKNIAVLMAAFKKIYKANPNTMLLIAGSGNLKSEIESKHAPNYPKGTIKFLNWVNHREMATIYAASDLMLFPSTTETFGNVILEAQSCALPTLVSNKGASRELVKDNETGFICRAHDSDSYVDAALKLMNNPTLHEKMRRNAASFGKQYTWSGAVDELFDHYGQVQQERDLQAAL